MDIMKRKTKQREKVRKEKTFTISLEFLQLGVGWSYSHLTENKTKQNKTGSERKMVSRLNSCTFKTLPILFLHAASQDILAHLEL